VPFSAADGDGPTITTMRCSDCDEWMVTIGCRCYHDGDLPSHYTQEEAVRAAFAAKALAS